MSTGVLGALAPTAMAALPCCSAARTTASPASGRAAVQPGDLLYPIGVCDEVLYVLGRMRVQQIIPVSEDRTAPGNLSPARSLAVLAPDLHHRGRPGVEGTDIPLHGPLPARSCST